MNSQLTGGEWARGSAQRRAMATVIALVVLGLLLGRSGADSQCPGWLEGYRSWHAENRDSPDATYLVHDCSSGRACNGVGDRIKGILYSLRIAALYRKVLLVAWETPVPLKQYLEPAGIDWTLQGLNRTLLLREKQAYSDLFRPGMQIRDSPGLGDLLNKQMHVEEFKALKVWRTQIFNEPQHRLSGSPDGDFMEEHGVLHFSRCLFNFLFKPAVSLMEEAQGIVQQLYGTPEASYIAWHWRTGGQVNEPILNRKSTTYAKDSSRLRQIMSVIACAETMPGKQLNDSQQRHVPPPSEQPLLLVTDHNLLRSFIAAGNLQRITATNDTVAHTRQTYSYKGGTNESVHTSWVDLALLAQADCLVYSRSGYSLVALWMGTTHCHMHLDTCLREQNLMFKGLEVRKHLRR